MKERAMPETFRITLAQLNPTVGDLPGNAAKARAAWEQARAAGSAMLVLPEMFITGYQTQDLVLKHVFADQAAATIEALAQDCADGPAIGIGPFGGAGDIFDGGVEPDVEDLALHPRPGGAIELGGHAPVQVAGDAAVAQHVELEPEAPAGGVLGDVLD